MCTVEDGLCRVCILFGKSKIIALKNKLLDHSKILANQKQYLNTITL